ncbi:MAG: preprotein translocase subunit SecD [Polaribacter sp.]|jgi:preprotein translocase subunit SecD
MSDERRRYFRIKDTANITVSLIDPSQLQTKIDDFWNEQQTHVAQAVPHQLNQQLEQHLSDFKVIEKQMPELARYLTVLQAQVDSLGAEASPEQTPIAKDRHEISLSGQSVAYTSEQKLTTDDTVELYLKLSTTGQTIKILAQVVKVEPISGKFRIVLDFTHIYESDQALLFKHIHVEQWKDIAAGRSTPDRTPDRR